MVSHSAKMPLTLSFLVKFIIQNLVLRILLFLISLSFKNYSYKSKTISIVLSDVDLQTLIDWTIILGYWSYLVRLMLRTKNWLKYELELEILLAVLYWWNTHLTNILNSLTSQKAFTFHHKPEQLIRTTGVNFKIKT